MIVSNNAARSRSLSCAVLLLSGMLLGGCADLRETMAAKPAFTDGVGTEPFNLTRDCIPAHQDATGQCNTTASTPPSKPSTYARISEMTDTNELVTWRNRFQDYLLWRSEKLCQIHKSGLMATQSGVNFGLNVLTTGVAGAAAVVTAPAANILAAVGAFSNGTRGHFNEDFYQRFVAPAMIKTIDSSRTDRLNKIMAKRGIAGLDRPTFDTVTTASVTSSGSKVLVTTQTPTPNPVPRKFVLMQDYTLEEAVADVERYHQLCSVTSALAVLVEDKAKFGDTTKGLQQRIEFLRKQQLDNKKQMTDLTPTGGIATASAEDQLTVKRLAEINSDIAKQIMVLQQQMLTAPYTTD